jgi:outer membrane protein TolC
MIALLALIPSLLVAQEAPRLTLQEALALGRAGNPSLLKVRSQTRQAQEAVSLSDAALLPTLSATSDLSRLGPNLAGDPWSNPAARSLPDNQWTTTLSARWTVFDGFLTASTRSSRRGLLEASQAKERGSASSLAAQIASSYLEAVRQQSLLKVRQNALAFTRERMDVTQARLRIGTGSLLDLQQVQLDANSDSSAWMRQNLSVHQSRRQLNWLLGRDPATPFRVEDSVALEVLPPFEELQSQARAQYEPLKESRARLASSRDEVRAISAEYLPSVSLYTNYVFLNQLRDSHPPANTYWQGFQYGAQVTLPLFEGGKTGAKSRSARETLRQSELSLSEAELQLARDLQQSRASAELALSVLELERNNALLAQSTLSLAMERHRIGQLSGIDLRRIQESSMAAQERAVSARIDAGIGQIQLFLLAGRPAP